MSVDPNGLLDLSEGGYSLVLRVAANGTIQRLAGNTAALGVGDGGPALQAGLEGGQGFSPGAVTFDPAGNLYFPEPGLKIIREVTNASYALTLSPREINDTSPGVQSFSIATSANFGEPFPYAVRFSSTEGAQWLGANRVTGLTGESITVSINPAGLAPGQYGGTVAVIVYLSGGSQEVHLPVALTVP